MERQIFTWNSPNLNKDMEIAVYGQYGVALLLFPTNTDNYLENEENGLIESIAPQIEKGRCRVYSVGAVNFESWLNRDIPHSQRSERHFQYNNYIIEEVFPFIFDNCGSPVPVMTCGASIGGYHAANNYFRRPDLFFGLIAMSATFNIEHFSDGHFDENCYFNSPQHYLPLLNDPYWLSFLKSRKHVYILSGSGDGEYPVNSIIIEDILKQKEIPCVVDLWDARWNHDFTTWKAMLSQYVNTKL